MNSVQTIKDHLIRQFHLPEEQIEQMLPSFISTLSSHMDNLQNALEDADLMVIGKLGHTIKGAFLNLGLDDCAQIALHIEESGKAEDRDEDFTALFDQLKEKVAPVFD